MPQASLALAELHLDLLYETDRAGALLQPRDPAVPSPLLHLVRTAEGNRFLLSAALTASERAQLQRELDGEPVIAGPDQMESHPPLISVDGSVLTRNGRRLRQERGPAFLFPAALPLTAMPAEILPDVRGVGTVPELAWLRAATAGEHPLAVARNSAGEVVAVCHSGRSTLAAAEAGVETARYYRGRGLAGAVVLAWATAICAEGRLPLYSTQWTNQASRNVASKLGLVMYGEDFHAG